MSLKCFCFGWSRIIVAIMHPDPITALRCLVPGGTDPATEHMWASDRQPPQTKPLTIFR